MLRTTRRAVMHETLSAVVSGILIVLLSLIAGGIIYVLAKDFIERKMRKKE